MLVLGYICSILFSLAAGAKILTVFPSSGYSQFILAERLIQELVSRGHEVTVISLYEPKDAKNYTCIHLADVLQEFKKAGGSEPLENQIVFRDIIAVHELGYWLTENILKHKKVQDLIHSSSQFDLVLVEQFFNEAHTAFATHFKAPLVLFSSIGLAEWNQHLTGNINLPTVLPVSFSPHTNDMNIFQRTKNTMIRLFIYAYERLVAYPKQQEFLDKYFPTHYNLNEVMYNASILLLNSDVSVGEPFQSNQATIEIGSFHISEKELPEHLETFLDEAEDGAILFSLGTNIKTTDMTKQEIEDILKVFKNLKQRVLWKSENIDIDLPDNVLISTWLPQTDVLAHPNTVLFITHAGLLSTTESVFFGVPMICIPIFGDQFLNTARSVKNGVAIKLALTDLNADKLNQSIYEVIENEEYHKNARLRSNLLRDKPMRPIDTAMYWIEHVLRHDGAKHLKSYSINLSWYQIFLFDFIFSTLTISIVIITTLSVLLKVKGSKTSVTAVNVTKKKRKPKKSKKE